MRTLPTAAALAALCLLAASCAGPRATGTAAAANPAEKAAAQPAEAAASPAAAVAPATAVVSIPVSGMHCGSCAARIAAALRSVEGVVAAETVVSEQRAVVLYAPARVAPAALVAAIRSAGYEPGEPVAQAQ